MENKCLFIHIPKTGGTSIIDALNPYVLAYGSQSIAPNSEFLLSLKFRFSFVRNPYNRYASTVLNLEFTDEDTFEQFTKTTFNNDYKRKFKEWDYDWMPLIPQHQYLYFDNKLEVDYIGKFENIEQDFKDVLRRLEIDNHLGIPIRLKHLNESVYENNYDKFYTPELREIINEAYKDDFLAFGYDMVK